ncbi:MAG: hypothetical protein QXT20_00025 [Candidatus Woesearchaeota archaeon]
MSKKSERFNQGRASSIEEYLSHSSLSKKFSAEELNELKEFLTSESNYHSYLKQVRENLLKYQNRI